MVFWVSSGSDGEKYLVPLSGQNRLPRIKHTQPLPLPTGAGPGPSLPEVVGRQTNPGPGLEDRIPQV